MRKPKKRELRTMVGPAAAGRVTDSLGFSIKARSEAESVTDRTKDLGRTSDCQGASPLAPRLDVDPPS
jgi:hypothetical protein